MTSNINVTEGSGKTVATEDIGGVQYQKVIIAGSIATVATNQFPSSVYVVNPVSTLSISTTAAPTSVQLLQGVATIGSVAVLQGTNPWQINVPSPSTIAYQLAGSVMAVSATVTTGNSSVQLVPSFVPIGSVTAFQGGTWVSSVFNYQAGTTITSISGTLTIGAITSGASMVGVYRERLASIPSAFGIPTLFKIDETNSVLTAVSPQNPFPVVINSTNVSILAVGAGTQMTSVMSTVPSSLMVGASIFGTVPVTQSGTWNVLNAGSILNIWLVPSIVGTYSEDSAHGTTDKGVFTMGVRNDAMSSVTSTDGDYSPFTVGPVGEMVVANAPITKWFSQTSSVMYGTSVQVVAAPGVSIFSYITGIHVMNESANFSRVTITQGLGGVANSILTRVVAPATGGSNSNYINGIRVLDNNGISASISGISSVLITITGFNSKV